MTAPVRWTDPCTRATTAAAALQPYSAPPDVQYWLDQRQGPSKAWTLGLAGYTIAALIVGATVMLLQL